MPGSHTDLGIGAFHHSTGTQNLRLRACSLYVLQVLLTNLKIKHIFQDKKKKKTTTKSPSVSTEFSNTLIRISRTSFGLVFNGMN